jgi:hypothetical protein
MTAEQIAGNYSDRMIAHAQQRCTHELLADTEQQRKAA